MGLFDDVLLTVDFDRTLTATDSTIPQRNMEAIRYFMDNGGVFTVNTGRSVPMSAENIIGKVPVNAPLLLYNGSADYDMEAGKLSRYVEIPLDPEQVLTDIQEKFPQLNVEIQALDAHYLLRKNPGWEDYSDHNQCAWKYVTDHAYPQPFIKFSVYGEFRKNTVAGMYEATEEELEDFRRVTAYIEETYGHAVDTFRACARILDMHAKGCGKLNAARALQNSLGRKYLVCVGDAENDLTMLQGADFAFCPSDGVVADRFPNVCPCDEGAVAEVIYEKIPQILKNKP